MNHPPQKEKQSRTPKTKPMGIHRVLCYAPIHGLKPCPPETWLGAQRRGTQNHASVEGEDGGNEEQRQIIKTKRKKVIENLLNMLGDTVMAEAGWRSPRHH